MQAACACSTECWHGHFGQVTWAIQMGGPLALKSEADTKVCTVVISLVEARAHVRSIARAAAATKLYPFGCGSGGGHGLSSYLGTYLVVMLYG